MVKMATDQEIPAVPVEEEAPLNFSELTPHQFGISTESFIPTSSNRKDKSRLAQIKARRRSSVGVRGSPETNSLIRFRAQQRMKTPPSSQSLELVMSSPFTLRQKMASFRSLMDVKESDACDPLPVQNNDTGGCIFTQDYLSGKENNPPTSPAPGKKRGLGPLKGCSVEIREDDISVCHSGLKDQEQEAPCKHQSPDRPPSDGPSAASPAQQSHLPHIPSLPSALEMKPTVDGDRTPAGKKKKQVRFGVPLSPEFFDKNLPPSTPLQKGGTPARAATPGGGLELRSVLKTPQRSESETQQNQPEPLCPAGFGASPTFAMPHRRRPSNEGDDWEDGKIVYPSMEEIDSAVLSDAECYFDAQPLNLNMAFHEESLSQTLNGDSEPTGTPQMDAMEGRECVAEDKPPEGDAGSQTLTQSKSRRKKKEEDSDSELRSRPDSRKRKANCLFAEQLEDSEPVKRSARSAAKAACRKMKGASTAARSWSKDVDRSLYGSRAYASKNPALSPITERRSFIGPSPSSEQTPDGSTGCDIFEVASGALNSEDFAEAVEVSSYDDVRPPSCSPGTDSRRPRSADRRGRKKKEQIDVGLCRADPEEPSEILCTDSNTYNVGMLTLDEESIPESEQRQGKQRRRSTVPLEPEHKEEGTGEMEQGDARSSSGQQGEVEGPNVDLAPWQADFNFEDVFKSVNPRRERSVRRSLRNRANSENSSVGGGLAWVPHTSPDSVRETRRRTRQRRLSAALLPPEETRDSASTELSEQ
ncbi:cell division cycle-associated protein 2 [Cyprinodon tularosa]|uniref:cell division cycle-associated protein 2 n=1 Tax=Cyprinodon tularosa TaxID=77115 RepID=UPI0018E21BF2|nr:cell division cycle-associated protein 2 [Cyprinodon tularosa]